LVGKDKKTPATAIVWYWLKDLEKGEHDPTSWEPYSYADCKKIEAAYAKGSKKMNVNKNYAADFKDMIQYRIDDSYRQRKIKRVEITLSKLNPEYVKKFPLTRLKNFLTAFNLSKLGSKTKLQDRLIKAAQAVKPKPTNLKLEENYVWDTSFVDDLLTIMGEELMLYTGTIISSFEPEEKSGPFDIVQLVIIDGENMWKETEDGLELDVEGHSGISSYEPELIRVKITLKVPNSSRALIRHMDGSYQLTYPETKEDENKGFDLKAATYTAEDVKEMDKNTHQCTIIAELKNPETSCEPLLDMIDEDVNSSHPEIFPTFKNLFEKHKNRQVEEGVLYADGTVPKHIHEGLMKECNKLAEKDEKDFHPFSKDRVLDLVHPALYPYVHGESEVDTKSEPEVFAAFAKNGDPDVKKKDFFLRPYESSKYQWLPAELEISPDGKKASFVSEVNHLFGEKFKPLRKLLAGLFVAALPQIEVVLGYLTMVQFLTGEDELHDFDEDDAPKLENLAPMDLKGKTIQVIPKIVDYLLSPEEEYEGVWHVEGMSHENVLATMVYILDRDEDIKGGSICFRRAYNLPEGAKFLMESPQQRAPIVDHIIQEMGLTHLGNVETKKNRLIVFPNTHVHKLSKMVNSAMAEEGNEGKRARRRIVVFFIVNPSVRIVSMKHVKPQQLNLLATEVQSSSIGTIFEANILEIILEYGKKGYFSLEEAKKHRLALMSERKYTKQDWNIRTIELCEH